MKPNDMSNFHDAAIQMHMPSNVSSNYYHREPMFEGHPLMNDASVQQMQRTMQPSTSHTMHANNHDFDVESEPNSMCVLIDDQSTLGISTLRSTEQDTVHNNTGDNNHHDHHDNHDSHGDNIHEEHNNINIHHGHNPNPHHDPMYMSYSNSNLHYGHHDRYRRGYRRLQE